MRHFLLSCAAMIIAISAQTQSWNLTGNAGTNPSTHFLGTTDLNPLTFRVGNYYSGEISPTNGKVALGLLAGQGPTSPYYCFSVAIGVRALYTNPGFENTAVGSWALEYNTSGRNSAFGFNAVHKNTSGSDNTGVGHNSLSDNTTGNNNTAVGTHALYRNTGSLGSFNTAVGSDVLRRTTASQYNTAIGFAAGDSYDLGWNNTIVGANSDGAFAGQYNIIAIGQGVVAPGSSTARIGNSATWSIGGYAGWTNFSDGRFKKDIQENVKGLDFIMKLRPVTYHLDINGVSKQSKENGGNEWDEKMKEAIAEKEKVLFTGFVAQEVEQAAKAAGFDFSGVDKPKNEHGFYGLRYADFVVPLVKGMQEQQQLINELIKVNAELQKRVSELEKRSGTQFSSEALSIRPNPANGKLIVNIDAGNNSKATIKIFDSKGALVKAQQANLLQGNNQVTVDINQLANGVYHVYGEWENGTVKKSVQLVKQ